MEFENVQELAKLPYFNVDPNGQLSLKANVLDHSIIDSHTHVGWSYLFGKPIDLWGQDKTKYFFPEEGNTFNLDHHLLADLTLNNRKICKWEVKRAMFDTKGYGKSHTIPNLLSEMDRFRVETAYLLAIDLPRISNNTMHLIKSLELIPNSRLKIMGSIHPLMNKRKTFDHYLTHGISGIKLHPQIQMFRPTSIRARRIYTLAAKNHLPIIMHTGTAPITPKWQRRFLKIDDVIQVTKDFPHTTFILGHAGMDQFNQLIPLANSLNNVYLELSSQTVPHLKQIITKTASEKLLYGSDWPFYPMSIPLARTLLATEGINKKYRSQIFYQNSLDLFKSLSV